MAMTVYAGSKGPVSRLFRKLWNLITPRQWRDARLLRKSLPIWEVRNWRRNRIERDCASGQPVCYNCRYYGRPSWMSSFGQCRNTANWENRRIDATGKGYITVDDPVMLQPVEMMVNSTCDMFTARQ